MPPPMMNQKEDYKCALQVIETELGNKCVETLKNIKEGYLYTALCLYHPIKSKSENDNVQMGLNGEIVPHPSLDVSLDSVSSDSSFDGFQNIQNVASSLNAICLFWERKINTKTCEVSSAPVCAMISSTEY